MFLSYPDKWNCNEWVIACGDELEPDMKQGKELFHSLYSPFWKKDSTINFNYYSANDCVKTQTGA